MRRLSIIIIIIAILLNTAVAGAAEEGTPPVFSIGFSGAAQPENVSVTLQIFLLLTVLTLVPAILVMLTSFTRIVIVLSLLRQAIGTQGVPPSQVVIGLALFLTFFIMGPVFQQVHTEALKPYMDKQISQGEAVKRAYTPVQRFMLKQTREKDLRLLADIAGIKKFGSRETIPATVLIPSFIISELKTAFQIGFLIYVPFLIIDMVVASILLSMGMMMLPPIMISLPFKLMLFVLVDGWHLIVGSLVKSFF
jgi:flagellar biosynthetic protein FliP